MDAPSTRKVVLKRKLTKAKNELERVQDVYDKLLNAPSVEGLNVRDQAKERVDEIVAEGRSVIKGLNDTIKQLKDEMHDRLKQLKVGPIKSDAQTSPIEMLEKVKKEFTFVFKLYEKKRKRQDVTQGTKGPKKKVMTKKPDITFGPSSRKRQRLDNTQGLKGPNKKIRFS